ncbi:MAG: hypothetical protein QOF02_279 [Blastocatellia bacterium]|jgi:hypothetical protein|nr:hypothetical protein [Blastocatellia bacterium]
MEKSRYFVVLALLLILPAILQGCSGKANNSPAAASKFLGTWKVAPDSETDFNGGPIIFKEDFTYSAQKTNEPSSSILTGPFTVSKDEKLFLGGELTKFGEEGIKVEPDGRLKLTKKGKSIYFVKS